MDILHNLLLGFSVAVSPINLLYCLIGCLLGTLIGVLPGIGPIATIAMLLPITFNLNPTSALIMLSGIYYGAQYGGSTTAILVNIPGESSSVVTCLDGYQMARQGRAGPALAIAAIGSFFAGCVAYGYLMKPLGLVLATVALVFISAFGGHEFKWKEVLILSVILVIFSVLVFVKGLTLPFPLCPDFIETCPIR